MIRFQCDTCGKIKEDAEAWILGFAAENIGIKSARREISITGAWDPARAVDVLAVHFCSDKCRARYVEALFGENPVTRIGDATVTTRRIKRVIPGQVVDTSVREREQPRLVKKTIVRRRKGA
ncbi:MAG TPA: hypothetical protein VFY05_12100 [Candidatus Angelobacter sp.]|jgi:hypothetical protein|nr:hypothetical protein [Candidatus Angelobacter sp.]